MPYPQEWFVVPLAEQRRIDQERQARLEQFKQEPRAVAPPPRWFSALLIALLALVLLGGIWLADWLMGRDAAVAGVCSAALVALSFWLACRSCEQDDKSL